MNILNALIVWKNKAELNRGTLIIFFFLTFMISYLIFLEGKYLMPNMLGILRYGVGIIVSVVMTAMCHFCIYYLMKIVVPKMNLPPFEESRK